VHIPDLDDPRERVLPRILRRRAEALPDAPYLLAGDEVYTYGRSNALANACAAGLRQLGVGAGEPVAFLLPSCPEFVFATFGVMKLGAVWIPTNVDYKGAWLRQGLEDSRARVLVADAALLPRVAEVAEGLPFEHVVVRGEGPTPALAAEVTRLAELLRLEAGEPEAPEAHCGDTAAVLWTSGTTGRSKGVMQSHNVWVRGAVSGARNAGTRAGDVMYCCLPMYNSAAWVAGVYRALVTGLSLGLDPAFSAGHFWERCRHYGATQIFTLGAMHMFLWKAPERPDDAENPVRHASMIPLPDALIEPMKRRFGLETIDQGYGQSEVMGLLHRRDDGAPRKPGSLGEPIEGIELALLDDEDRPVPPGEVGEFCVRPTQPHVIFNGYFHDPEATLRSCRNLWYHTGDLGRRDADGDWFFVDRKADFMRYKGRNVSSFAVEAAVNAHPAVRESAAHGVVSDELESESEIKVCVVLEPGACLAPEELARFVNDTAPYFFVPRYVEFLEELPHTPTGRVQKFKLRERGVTPATWDRVRAGFELRR
jgi:crotonobetaine/carnitine-CoA ligase